MREKNKDKNCLGLQYLVLSACLGMITLGLQMVTLKQLMGIFTDSILVTSITISVYLAGLAIGNYSASALNQTVMQHSRFVFILFCLLLTALAGYSLFVLSNDQIIWEVLTWKLTHPVLGYGLMVIGLVPIGFSAGFCLPLLSGCYIRSIPPERFHSHEHRYAAYMLLWDTFGSILGALLAGVVLLPLYGMKTTFFVLSCLALAVAFIAVCRKGLMLYALMSVLVLVTVVGFSGKFLKTDPQDVQIVSDGIPGGTEVLFKKNSPFGMIRVSDSQEAGRILWINRRSMVATKSSYSERALARLVMEELKGVQTHQSGALNVLNIGLGGGLTASEVLQYPPVSLTVSEINPVIVEAAKTCFFEFNGNLLNPKAHKNVRLKIENGMDTLVTSSAKYWDGIIIDIEEPTIIYSSILYTKEAFEIMRDKMTVNGVGGVWCHSRYDDYAKVLLNTIRSVFPYVALRVLPLGFDSRIQAYPLIQQDLNGRAHFVVAEDTRHWVFAIFFSKQPLSTIKEPTFTGEQERISSIESSPVTEINTRDQMVLEKYFRINDWFRLEKNYQEEFYLR